MEKILSITYPTITSFPGRANIYAISENNAICHDWLMENYIQTESLYISHLKECDIDFFIPPTLSYRNNSAIEAQYIFNPYLQISTLPAKLIPTKQIISFIIDCINNNYYINIDINTSQIINYSYQQLHPIFIFGYNQERETFYIADFFQNNKYSFQTCSFYEMEHAILKYDISLRTWGGLPNEIGLISLIKIDPNFSHIFSIDTFQKNIKEYLNLSSTMQTIFENTNHRIEETPYRKFGNLHYDNMQNYLLDFINAQTIIKNIRLFHVFYDHKKSIRQRVEYLEQKGYIENKWSIPFREIEKEALIIRNSILKVKISQNINGKCYEDIILKLKYLKNKEYEFLSKLVSYLS